MLCRVCASLLCFCNSLCDHQQVYGDDGIKRHPLFFLGMGKKGQVSESSLVSKSLSVMPPDVQHERNTVASASALTHGVIIKDLNKIYETEGEPKMAVKTLSLAIPRNQCVGLLGPNGAGKSTTVSMLCGFFEPSAGTALVEGYDITKDMDSVYTIMSVCPQDNLLWESLTGEEHLFAPYAPPPFEPRGVISYIAAGQVLLRPPEEPERRCPRRCSRRCAQERQSR